MISSAKMIGTERARPSEYQQTAAVAATSPTLSGHGKEAMPAAGGSIPLPAGRSARARPSSRRCDPGRDEREHHHQAGKCKDVRRRRSLEGEADHRGDRRGNDGTDNEDDHDERRDARRQKARAPTFRRSACRIRARRPHGSVTSQFLSVQIRRLVVCCFRSRLCSLARWRRSRGRTSSTLRRPRLGPDTVRARYGRSRARCRS